MTAWADDALQGLEAAINDPAMASVIVAGLVLLIGSWCYFTTQCVTRWTQTKPWWPDAKPRQKQLLLNFLYAEELCTDKSIMEGWSYILTICIHHFFAGSLLLPVVFLGWTDAGSLGQLLFYIGILLELGFDAWDWCRATILCWCPKLFPCMCQVSVGFWFIAVVCHHTLGCLLILPMLLVYPYRPEFHRIASSLLMAAGFAYLTGAYKFTLNTSETSGWYSYKAIVVFQLVVIYYTRLWLWFIEAYSLLSFFNDEEAWIFWWGGLICSVLMSGFNMVLVVDCTQAAIKWLPRSMAEGDAEIAELEESKTATSFATLGNTLRNSFARRSGADKEDLVEMV